MRFRPRWLPAVAALCAIALFVTLGRWQLGRAEEKRALRQAAEAAGRLPPLRLTGTEVDGADLRFRRLEVAGEFDTAGQIFQDNKVEGGEAGYHVLAPLKIEGSTRYVLVNRGWVARGPDYPEPPRVPLPTGPVRIQGQGVLPAKRFLELSADTVQGAVWQNLTFERYRRATGLDILPVVVEQRPAAPGLKPVSERPDLGEETHRGYALQWFALAAASAAAWLATALRRP